MDDGLIGDYLAQEIVSNLDQRLEIILDGAYFTAILGTEIFEIDDLVEVLYAEKVPLVQTVDVS